MGFKIRTRLSAKNKHEHACALLTHDKGFYPRKEHLACNRMHFLNPLVQQFGIFYGLDWNDPVQIQHLYGEGFKHMT